MSSKVIVAALAVVALQALWVQASSIGVADSNALGLKLAGVDLTLNITLPTLVFDFGAGNPIVQALRNRIEGIVVRTYLMFQTYLNAGSMSIQDATEIAQAVEQEWTDLFHDLRQRFQNSPNLTPCLEKYRSLQNLTDSLWEDEQECAVSGWYGVVATVPIVQGILTRAVNLVGDIRQAFLDCLPSGLLSVPCFAAKSPQFFAEASDLATNATYIANYIFREAISQNQKDAACNAAAIQKWSAEATSTINAIETCIEDGGNGTPQ